MNFQKFVQRSTKGLFLFIAIMMVVPLVLWGYMGRMGGEKDGEEDAGIIFQNVHISRNTFNQQKRRAYPSYYYSLYQKNPRMTFMAMRGGRLPEPPADELNKITWKNIVLLEEARRNGIPPATELEMQHKSEQLFMKLFFGQIPHNEQTVPGVAQQLFRASVADYDAWITDLVVIEKLLDLASSAEFASYSKIYDKLLTEQQSARATVAGFDPKDYVRELKPPRTEEIAKYYQDNKFKFKTPEKVSILYLIAEVDELMKKEPSPSEDAVRKYYDEHRQEFAKPAPEHKHGPGEEHKEDEKPQAPEPKPFDEVKGEIPDKIKRSAAQAKAKDLMKSMNQDLGEAFVKNGNKYPDNILNDLQTKCEREKGVRPLLDNTALFDRRRVEEIEKLIGTGSGLEAWAFDSKRVVGDISNIVSTSKGEALFKIIQKKAADENPGVSIQNREAIVKELQKEQLRKRAQQQASMVVDEIKAHGIAEARVKFPEDWRSTRYFKLEFTRGDPSADDPGLDDRALGGAVRSLLGQRKPQAGEALVLQGSMVGGEKKDWSFVVYVDDVLSSIPDDFDAKFKETRREMDADARSVFQERYASDIILKANVNDLVNKKDASGTPRAPVAPERVPDDDSGP